MVRLIVLLVLLITIALILRLLLQGGNPRTRLVAALRRRGLQARPEDIDLFLSGHLSREEFVRRVEQYSAALGRGVR